MTHYSVPAVGLNLHVRKINRMIGNCQYSQLTPRTTPTFFFWLSRRGPCSVKHRISPLNLHISRPNLQNENSNILGMGVVRSCCRGFQKNSKFFAHQYATQSVPVITVSFLPVRFQDYDNYCDRHCAKAGFHCTQIANTFEFLFHGPLPTSNFLKTMSFLDGNFAGPYARGHHGDWKPRPLFAVSQNTHQLC